MTNEVVTHAPKAVIEELDDWKENTGAFLPYEMYLPGGLLDASDGRVHTKNLVAKWVYVENHNLDAELAVINHVFGNERLQPEREPRWYVELGFGIMAMSDDNFPKYYIGIGYMPPEHHMTEKQARGYAELFGGEAKEIK